MQAEVRMNYWGVRDELKSNLNSNLIFPRGPRCLLFWTSLVTTPRMHRKSAPAPNSTSAQSERPGKPHTSVSASIAFSSNSVMVFLTPSCTCMPRFCTRGRESCTGWRVMWKVCVTYNSNMWVVAGPQYHPRLSPCHATLPRNPGTNSLELKPKAVRGCAWAVTKNRGSRWSPVCLPIPLNTENSEWNPTQGWVTGPLLTSCTPSDSTKLKASDCLTVLREWTYWTLCEIRSAWVKELIWTPNERRREKQERHQDTSHPSRQGDARLSCRVFCILYTASMLCPWRPVQFLDLLSTATHALWWYMLTWLPRLLLAMSTGGVH